MDWPGIVSGGSGWLVVGGAYRDVDDDAGPVAGKVGGGGGSDGGGGAVTGLLCGHVSRCVGGGGLVLVGATGAGVEPLTVRTGLGIDGIVSTELPPAGVTLDVAGSGVPAAGLPKPLAGAPNPGAGCCVPDGAMLFGS